MTEQSQVWREYSGKLAWPTVLLAAFTMIGFTTVLVLALVGVLPLWVAFLLQVLFGYFAFTPIHEATHHNVGGQRDRRWVDDLVGWMMATVDVSPYPVFKAIHLRHHGRTNHGSDDPDFWVAGRTPVGVFLRCLTILPHYYYVLFRNSNAISPIPKRQWHLSLVYMVVIWSGILTLIVGGFGWAILFAWILPAIVSSAMLAFVFDWLPHVPHKQTGRYRDTRVVLGPALGWLTFGQSYHLVHHLWPRIPFYSYGAVFRRVEQHLREQGSQIDRL